MFHTLLESPTGCMVGRALRCAPLPGGQGTARPNKSGLGGPRGVVTDKFRGPAVEMSAIDNSSFYLQEEDGGGQKGPPGCRIKRAAGRACRQLDGR